MSKCYVNVVGGLGNQLFQIAAGYAYSKRYDKEMLINYSDWTASQGNHVLSYKDTIFKNFKYESISNTEKVSPIEEIRFNYSELPYHSGDVSLNGYFQSLKYFEDCKDEFISLLHLPECPTYDDAVAVHIRRGDYLKFAQVHYVCSAEYFKENIKQFPDKKIHIFTDSEDFVRNEFSDYNLEILSTESELGDLTAMANHDNMICSNSTFSWWASLLGVKKKKVIVPNKWFNDHQEYDDIYRADFTISSI
jgi:hypothetical protein